MLQLFVSGSSVGTPYTTSNNESDGYCYIGRSSAASQWFNGYLAHFRVTNGYCRYAANFATPSIPFYTALDVSGDPNWNNQIISLNFDSNFNDSSGNAIVLTNTGSVVISNSVYKVGSGSAQFIHSNNSSLYNSSINVTPLLTGDFSCKMWVYLTGTQASNYYILQVGFNGQFQGIMFNGSNTTPCVMWGGSVIITSSGGNIPTLTWVELELVKVGGIATLYVAGQNVGSAAAGASTSTLGISIGGYTGNSGYTFDGHIDNLEITGFGSPTANFTPWASPFLTALPSGYDPFWQQTTLCLPFDGSATDVSGNGITLTNTGSVTFAATAKVGTFAASFNGSSAVLSATGTNAFNVGYGDFTIEGWLNATSFAGSTAIFTSCTSNGSATGAIFFVNGSGTLYISSGTTPFGTSTFTLPTGAYVHVAIVRKGTKILMFKSGALDATIVDGSAANFTDTTVKVGLGYAGGNMYWNGVIDQFRITKAARYTANFTPPTTAFLTVGPV